MSIAYFPMYGSYEEIFETLTDAQIGALVRGSLHYFNSGERGTMTRHGLAPLYTMLCRDIDLSAEAYEEKCEKSRASARKRWNRKPEETCERMPTDADVCERMPTHADACERMPNKDKDKGKTNTNTKARAREEIADAPARAEEREDRFAEEDAAALFGIEPGFEDTTAETVRQCGSFSNVPLTESQLERLHRELPEADEYIERLSEHIASTGRTYADCCATIFKWVREDRRKSAPKEKPAQDGGSFDTDEFFEAALRRSYRLMEQDAGTGSG